MPTDAKKANKAKATPPASRTMATAGQETKPGVGGDLATIIQSGSTNTLGYNVVIHNDGSATAKGKGTMDSIVVTREFPLGTIDTRELRRLLTETGDVSKIPTTRCPKSASCGTTTEISYAGKVSGDLQCIATDGDQALLQASKNLYEFVQTTLRQLSIDDKRVSPEKAD